MKKVLLIFTINNLNAQQDCINAIDICDSSSITVYPDGIGYRDFNCSPI